jgi:hypothetical protein
LEDKGLWRQQLANVLLVLLLLCLLHLLGHMLSVQVCWRC